MDNLRSLEKFLEKPRSGKPEGERHRAAAQGHPLAQRARRAGDTRTPP